MDLDLSISFEIKVYQEILCEQKKPLRTAKKTLQWDFKSKLYTIKTMYISYSNRGKKANDCRDFKI